MLHNLNEAVTKSISRRHEILEYPTELQEKMWKMNVLNDQFISE